MNEMLGMMPLFRQEFRFRQDYIFLNHAAVSPWPQRTADVVSRFAQENVTSGPNNYLNWVEVETKLREQLASLINAPSPDDIALVKNTSEGLSFVAYGLGWNVGDNIVSTNQEFPSNKIVWDSLSESGVSLRQVNINDGECISAEDALEQACDENTRLLTVSSVQFASGLALDLVRLGQFCKKRDILFCVDAIQSIGALQMDVQACNADFVIADGHKWMMAPEGIGVFYCKRDMLTKLKLHEFGWHMVKNPSNYDAHDWEVAETARRFECGSPNMLGVHALSASVGLLLEIGMERVEKMVCAAGLYLEESLSAFPDIEIINKKSRKGGIVSFKHAAIESEVLFKQLIENKIICALRSGCVRLSPHFYTQFAQIDQAVSIIKSKVQSV